MDVAAAVEIGTTPPLRVWTGKHGLRLDGANYVGAGSVLSIQLPPSALAGGDGSVQLECIFRPSDAADVLAVAPGPLPVTIKTARKLAAGWAAVGPTWAGVLGPVTSTRFAAATLVRAECVPLSRSPAHDAEQRRWSAQDQLDRTDNRDTAFRRLAGAATLRRHSFPRTIRG